MANVTNLKMAQRVLSNPLIEIKKGFLGLSTTVIYQPTGSRLKALQLEYSPADGPKILTLLGQTGAELAARVAKVGKLQTVANGNYNLDLSFSTDRQFASLQLFQFQQLDYQPVSEVFMYEGKDADTILSVLL